MKVVLERPKSLRELALEYLRERIVEGTYPMGSILSERKISDALGVSKSPVREALAQLRDEGLVEIEPQKGARVFSLSVGEVIHLCDFREALEITAFELALKRNQVALADEMQRLASEMEIEKSKGNESAYISLDNEYHQLVFEYAGNPYLSASYERYSGKISALRYLLSSLPQHTDLSFDEHKEIAVAVGRGALGEIVALTRQHIDRTRKAYQEAISSIAS